MDDENERPGLWRDPRVIASVASGVLLLVGWLLSFTAAAPAVSTGLYLAAIAVGGLISATLLTLYVLPALYAWFERDAGAPPDEGELAGTTERHAP